MKDKFTDAQIEEQLKNAIPEDRWTEAHHTIIFHGRRCCSARSPQCDTCPLVDICLKRGV
jgi:endonuclease-3